MPDKRTLRADSLQRRDSIPSEVKNAKNRLIRANLEALEEIKSAGSLFFFASFRSEVDTSVMIKNALSAGKRVILPKVDIANRMLQLYEVGSLEDLTPGYMGIPEPGPHSGKGGEGGSSDDGLCGINDIDAVIIPGACFDEMCNRIGYGGGYYDRLLAGLQKTVPVIAPAFEEQIVGEVPAEPHDVRVSIIVTDRRVIRCDSGIGQ